MKAKLVKEDINELLKSDGVTYDRVKIGNDVIFVGKEGIMGRNENLVSWDIIFKLANKYNK